MLQRYLDVEQPSVVSGVIEEVGAICRYTLFQPAVTQWVAIGVLEFDGSSAPILLVESSRIAIQALEALRLRVADRATQRHQRLASLAA